MVRLPPFLFSFFPPLQMVGLRPRDIRSVDPSLFLTNSMPSLLVFPVSILVRLLLVYYFYKYLQYSLCYYLQGVYPLLGYSGILMCHLSFPPYNHLQTYWMRLILTIYVHAWFEMINIYTLLVTIVFRILIWIDWKRPGFVSAIPQ